MAVPMIDSPFGGRQCRIENCCEPHKGRGLCNRHLKRLRKFGDPLMTVITASDEKRRERGSQLTLDWLFSRAIPEPNSGCWIWLYAIGTNGYGAINIRGKTRAAHRVAYEVATSTIVPREIDVCHSCDVRVCINPDHLFAGTRLDNMQDCIAKGRFKPLVPMSGDDSPNSKLSSDQVLAIRADRRSNRSLARAYGVDRITIASIRLRKTWRHI